MDAPSFVSSVSSATASTADARAILEQLGIPSAEAVSLIKAAVDEIGSDVSASALVRAAMKSRG